MKLFCQFALCPAPGVWPVGKRVRQLFVFLSKSSISFDGAAFPFVKGEWTSASAFSLPAYTSWEQVTTPREAASYHSRLGADCFPLKQ